MLDCQLRLLNFSNFAMFGIMPTDFVGTKWAGHRLRQVVAEGHILGRGILMVGGFEVTLYLFNPL